MTNVVQQVASYQMSRTEFVDIILPLLTHYPFGLTIHNFAPRDIINLWRSSFRFEKDKGHINYESANARDALIGRIHPTVISLATKLRRNYEVLRHSQDSDFIKIRILIDTRCKCLRVLDGVDVSVKDMIAAFENPIAGSLVLPPFETVCGKLDSPYFCDTNLLPLQWKCLDANDMFETDLQRILDPSDGRQLRTDWRIILINTILDIAE